MSPNIPSHLLPSKDSNLSFPGSFKPLYTPPSWVPANPMANIGWYMTYAKSLRPFSLHTLLSLTLTLSSLLSSLKHKSLLY
jgi:hypothetical protein